MNKYRFEIITGILLLAIFILFCIWETPSLLGTKLSKAEIDQYLKAADKQLLFEEKEKTLARIRTWAEADDGKPVYMLNLMRRYPEILRLPGAPDFRGTPEEANRHYESKAIPMLLKNGGYPLFAGVPQGKSVVLGTAANSADDLTRVLVVRYTNRRSFLELLADPAYAPIEPYKMMAFDVTLLPMSAETIIPDTRYIVASLLLTLFLAVGWFRSTRRNIAA